MKFTQTAKRPAYLRMEHKTGQGLDFKTLKYGKRDHNNIGVIMQNTAN